MSRNWLCYFGRSQKIESVPVGKSASPFPEECHPKAIRSGQSKVSIHVKGRGAIGAKLGFGAQAKWRGSIPEELVWRREPLSSRVLETAASLALSLVLPQCLCSSSPQNGVWFKIYKLFISGIFHSVFLGYKLTTGNWNHRKGNHRWGGGALL